MKTIAHRGLSDLYKDNTVFAFQAAREKGFHMLEFDIQLTKDQKIIIYHDIYIKNKLNSTQLINQLNYATIKDIDNDIILLSDLFSFVNENEIEMYIDIKGNDIQICSELLEMIKDRNLRNIYIASFNVNIIERLNKLSKEQSLELKLGIILETLFSIDLLHQFSLLFQIRFFSFHWTMLDLPTIHFLKSQNIEIYTYTCKNNFIEDYMRQYPIDGIVTNYMFY